MKYKMSYLLFLLILLAAIPYVITVSMTKNKKDKEIDFSSYKSGYYIILQRKKLDLETYLLTILPGQISMDDKEEALKAQAVILRTDIVRRMGKLRTMDAKSIPYQSQTNAQLKKILGEKQYDRTDQLRKKVVSETIKKVIVYKGNYIEPYFHGVSVGTTLDGKEWFGKEISYLKAKDSVKDVESPDYVTIKEETYGNVWENLKFHHLKVKTVEDVKKNLRIVRATKNGYVKEIQVGNGIVSGNDFARWFSLVSNNFYLESYGGKLRIICLGKGNGLGLSQYGAEKMAENGSTYKNILKYYYSNIQIVNLNE